VCQIVKPCWWWFWLIWLNGNDKCLFSFSFPNIRFHCFLTGSSFNNITCQLLQSPLLPVNDFEEAFHYLAFNWNFVTFLSLTFNLFTWKTVKQVIKALSFYLLTPCPHNCNVSYIDVDLPFEKNLSKKLLQNYFPSLDSTSQPNSCVSCILIIFSILIFLLIVFWVSLIKLKSSWEQSVYSSTFYSSNSVEKWEITDYRNRINCLFIAFSIF
jgi:hypothetical protein